MVAWLLAGAMCPARAAGGETIITTVSAASYLTSAPVAPGSIAAGFGSNLAEATEVAPAAGPLPSQLAGTEVLVTGSDGIGRPALLWFVSPGQINFQIADATPPGRADVRVRGPSGVVAAGTLQVEATAPGLFTMNADGKGVPAAQAVVVKGDGSSIRRYVFNAGCAPGSCYPVPLDGLAETGALYLELYGTGIRGRSSLGAVAVEIGGAGATVEYAGPVSGMVGLDQVNVAVPASLIGRGEATVALTVDGRPANPVTVNLGVLPGASGRVVELAWTVPPGAPATGYHVYRGTARGGPYARVNSALLTGTSYVDTGTIGGTTYYYVVTCVDGLGDESPYSNEGTAAIPAP